MSAHHPTKAEAAAAEAKAEKAAEAKAEKAATVEAKAKHDLAASIKDRIAAERAAHPHLEPALEGSLIGMLEGKADEKTPAQDEIHLRLEQVRVFVDQAIREAEGGLRTLLEQLRRLLF